jgi:ABC-type multidrug transport system fused ATPase/permease subunit
MQQVSLRVDSATTNTAEGVLVSLERIVAYTEAEQERKSTEDGKPPAAWPTSGEIRVENLTARYSKVRMYQYNLLSYILIRRPQDGPKVLHGLSFSIRSGERVGVVGRTGSGKVCRTICSSHKRHTESICRVP